MKEIKLEVIRFSTEDVIATSAQVDCLETSGFANGIKGDIKLKYNGVEYGYVALGEVLKQKYSKFDSDSIYITSDTDRGWIPVYVPQVDITDFVNDEKTRKLYNGTFYYKGYHEEYGEIMVEFHKTN